MSMDGSRFMEMCFGLRFTLSYLPVWLGVVISWLSWLLAVSSVNSWVIFIHSKSLYFCQPFVTGTKPGSSKCRAVTIKI